jgi:hypothetical protein
MARDANGEVWVERGGQLTTLNPHRKVRFDAMRLTLNHVVVGLGSSDEEERVEHGRVAKVEFDPGPTGRAAVGRVLSRAEESDALSLTCEVTLLGARAGVSR